jgi:LacI family transcriptional regulator
MHMTDEDTETIRRPAANARSQRVTIKDVAAAARVSAMTVSNVLKGRYQFVSARTREVVEGEIARLGYRVQKQGRNLRDARHRAVGLVIVDKSPSFLSDPFTANMAAGLSNVLSRVDYSLSVQGIAPDKLGEARLFQHFEVDGFCIALSGAKDLRAQMVDAVLGLRQPIVFLQEPMAARQADCCVVREDDFGGGRVIGEHLAARGVRRVLLILPGEEWPAMEEREAGLRHGLRAGGRRPTLAVVQAQGEEFEPARAAVQGYLERHPLPDGIVGGNDRLALAAMTLLAERGIAVPGQVKVAGFNAFEPRKYVRPLLTTVVSPAYSIGETAGDIMLKRLHGSPFERPEILLPMAPAIGDST